MDEKKKKPINKKKKAKKPAHAKKPMHGKKPAAKKPTLHPKVTHAAKKPVVKPEVAPKKIKKEIAHKKSLKQPDVDTCRNLVHVFAVNGIVRAIESWIEYCSDSATLASKKPVLSSGNPHFQAFYLPINTWYDMLSEDWKTDLPLLSNVVDTLTDVEGHGVLSQERGWELQVSIYLAMLDVLEFINTKMPAACVKYVSIPHFVPEQLEKDHVAH